MSVGRLIKSAVKFVSDHRVVFSRLGMVLFMMCFTVVAFADAGAGTTAIENATGQLKNYVDPVRDLCYALAAVIAIVGAISVYIKMNNEEQDVKKSIMLIVGACVFLIAAATFLPTFFGK